MEQYLGDIFKHTHCIGVLITDGEGKIIQVEERYDDTYGIPSMNLVGESVFDLEKRGIFKPSIAAIVLATQKDTTIVQELANGQKVIVTAFPLFDENHKIEKVVTFTRGIEEYIEYRNRYEELNRKIDIYNKNLNEIGFINENDLSEIVTTSGEFQKVLDNMKKAAQYDVSIILEGETGVGKSLLAKRIHRMSNFSEGRFIEINCGALPENLIESELFGYEKGAFTGADQKGKVGLIEIAANGSLLLDEVSELPLPSQVKLLQVLQEKRFRRIGGTADIKVTCRIIAASNKNLEDEVKNGRFRNDLLYRLNTVSCIIPPLRERKDDIIPLCKTFLNQANERYGTNRIFAQNVLRCMSAYSWPGNVRELEHLVNRLAILAEDNIITIKDLPEYMMTDKVKTLHTTEDLDLMGIRDLKTALQEYESTIINFFYRREGSSVKLAKALNISQSSAIRKVNKYVDKS